MGVSNLVRMVVFMQDSEPPQRLVFCSKFVTFLKGTKAKSNPVQVVSFSTCNEWARMCITGLLKLQYISVAAVAFPLQQKQEASLWKPGLCCSSLPFCFKLKDVPSPVAFSSSLSVHSTLSSLPFYTWCNHHLLQATFSALHLRVAPFIPPHPLATHILYLCLCVTILCNSCFLLGFCGHNCNDFWWSKADFHKQGVFSAAVPSIAMGETQGCYKPPQHRTASQG